jgi:hypothetical protein
MMTPEQEVRWRNTVEKLSGQALRRFHIIEAEEYARKCLRTVSIDDHKLIHVWTITKIKKEKSIRTIPRDIINYFIECYRLLWRTKADDTIVNSIEQGSENEPS